jgi:hypothetical protein
LTGEPTIESRLAEIEDREREIWELRRALSQRLAEVRQRRGVFDATARAQLARLRELESAVRLERREIDVLVDEARATVETKRAEARLHPSGPTAHRQHRGH